MKKRTRPVFRPGGARRLLESSGEAMSDEERMLLLALLEVDADNLDGEERAALEAFKARAEAEGQGVGDLTRAVKQMVKAKPRKGRRIELPEALKRRLKKKGTAQ